MEEYTDEQIEEWNKEDLLSVPDDAPWLNLTPEEVKELRKNKKQLTEYGKEKIRKLMNSNPTHEEMLEMAYDREEELYGDESFEMVHSGAFMPYNENEKLAKREQINVVLQRYNEYYNTECSGLSHGGPVSMEELQAIVLDCMVDAFICDNLNREYNAIDIDDIRRLSAALYQQGRDFVKNGKYEQ